MLRGHHDALESQGSAVETATCGVFDTYAEAKSESRQLDFAENHRTHWSPNHWHSPRLMDDERYSVVQYKAGEHGMGSRRAA